MVKDRVAKVDELLRHEVSLLLLREFEFPHGTLVTVTRVHTASDLLTATVFTGVTPFEHAHDCVALIKRHAGKLQHLLNTHLRMRFVPRLTFVLDEEGEQTAEIEKLLDSLSS